MHAKSLTWYQRDAAVQRHISIVTETYPPEINGVALTLEHLLSGLRMKGYGVSVARMSTSLVSYIQYTVTKRLSLRRIELNVFIARCFFRDLPET